MKNRLTNQVICFVLALLLAFGGGRAFTQSVSVSLAENGAVEQITSSAAASGQIEHTPISWTLNDDGSFTFAMEGQGENSQYAWYVLDSDNEPYFKTKYSEDNTFTYHLSDEKAKVIKCFVREYSGEEYEQQSYKILCEQVREAQALLEREIEAPAITWQENDDGSFTFTMGWQGVNSRYAWYVLDSDNEPYFKTKYSEDNIFTYDLSDEKAKVIKCFVRIYSEDEYEQNTYKISTENIGTEKKDVTESNTIKPTDTSMEKRSKSFPHISYEYLGDGYFQFAMEATPDDSEFSWYILDENNQTIYKTKYSKNNVFTFDLSDVSNQVVKCFVQIKTDEGYEQKSYKIDREIFFESASPESEDYFVVSTEVTEEARAALRQIIINDIPPSSAKAQKIVDGTAYGYPITLPIDWSCTDIEDRSIAFQISGMSFLSDIFREWCDTESEEYRELLETYILDFARYQTEDFTNDDITWHDHATGKRVHRMSVFYDAFYNDLTEEERGIIEESLREQARVLMYGSFYTAKHNHGVFQDLGVLSYALLVCKDEAEKQTMISTALKRTTNYIEYVYTADGVHKEHSPWYAIDILRTMIDIQKIAERNVPAFVHKTRHYISDNVSFILQDIEPDGTFPSVGDNAQNYKKVNLLSSEFDDNDEVLYLRTKGQTGKAPVEASVYSEGGYAFFRSSWDDPADQATWLMFIAATHSSTHKHGDDLSFLLYHKGELFVEAGSRNYNYSDQQTFWAYTGYAHNVLLIDGEAFPVKVGANGWQSVLPDAYKTHITDFDLSDPEHYSVSGSCERFPGVLWNRSLEYSKEAGTVIVTDEMESTEEKAGTLVFHIAEGVSVEQTVDGWDMYRDGEKIASVTVSASQERPTLTTYTSEGIEPYYTWIFNGNAEPVYGTVLTVDFAVDEQVTAVETRIQLY